jgi:hypothetical protein
MPIPPVAEAMEAENSEAVALEVNSEIKRYY